MNSILSLFERIGGKVSIVGSMNADYTVTTQRLPQPGETVLGGQLEILPGGKSGNQAAQAAKLGAHVTMFGAVGDDDNAQFLTDSLQRSGVDVQYVRHVAEQPSGTTVIAVDNKGENTIIYSPGANREVTTNYIEQIKASLLKSDVLGLCLESPMETVCLAAQLAHDAGLPVLLNNSPFQENLPQDLIDNTDILLVNEHEMAQLLHCDPPQDGDWRKAHWKEYRQAMSNYGIKQAIITLGGEGAVVMNGSEITFIDPVKIVPVDTTGCGDSFMGTILAGLSSKISLEDSARIASYVAGFAALQQGAQASYGTPEEITHYFSTVDHA